MVVLNRIYTRTGDDGTTALGSGERRPKYDLRIGAYGTVDETNAAIGIVRLHLKEHRELDAMLGQIQNDLFDLGADLAVPEREGKPERLRMLASQVERLERDIDTLNAHLAPLTSFVLPGGTPAAAHLHLARTICRRAERMMVELAARPDEPVGGATIQYMNRLSDFLFVASRAVNDNGAGDVLWVPGGGPDALKAMMQEARSAYLDYLRQVARGARWVCSVCEGALLLARAGLLDGHAATTHWAFVACLQRFPNIQVDTTHQRFIVSGNRLTGGGISSGLDEALQLISLLFGTTAAMSVQVTTQYFPRPPVAGVIPSTPKCMIDWG